MHLKNWLRPAAIVWGVLVLAPAWLAAQTPPTWLTDLESAYPSKVYVAFLGTGPSLSQARDDGLTQAAKYFGVKVEALSEGSKVYSQGSGGTSLDTQVAETVKIRANEDLFAIRYSDPFTSSKGATYMVAFFKKAEVAENLADTVASLNKRLTAVLKSLKAADNGAIKLARAYTAKTLGGQIDTILKKLALLDSDAARAAKKGLPLDEAFDAWEDTRRAERFAVAMEGERSKDAAAKIASLITSDGFSTDDKGRLAVTGSISLKPVTITTTVEGLSYVQYAFTIRLADEKKRDLVVVQKSEQTYGTTLDAAKARAYVLFEQFVTKDFMGKFHDYLAAKVLD